MSNKKPVSFLCPRLSKRGMTEGVAMSEVFETEYKLVSKSQRWQINHFENLPRHAVWSPVFTVGPHSWALKLWANGDGEQNAGWVSLYLVLRSAAKRIRLQHCRFAIIGPGGQRLPVQPIDTKGVKLLMATDVPYGSSRLLSRQSLAAVLRADKASLTVEVQLALHAATHSVAEPQLERVRLPDCGGLLRSMDELARSGLLSDVTLRIAGTELRAHRCVLAARSPVFKVCISQFPTNLFLCLSRGANF